MDAYTKQMIGLLNESKGLFNLPRIDYFEFRDKWLPLFSANANDGLAPLGEWVQAVARGCPFMPVEVYKGGRVVADPLYGHMANPDSTPITTIEGGEYMFTVPQILNNEIKIELKDGQSIDHVAVQANEISKRVAAAGDRYLKKNLTENVNVTDNNAINLSSRMDEIFKHFGVMRGAQLSKSTEAPKPIDPQPQSLSNDDLDFDF